MTNTVGDAQIKLGLDSSGVVTGIGEAKKSIDSLGASTQKAVGPITPEMEKASAATQRFAREVVKAELAAISGGKATAAYKQGLAELNGLSVNALKPYLESLRATEQAQRAATAATLSGNAALNGMGITAKQTAAALRNVPAQFTDIIVSLQGGQAPLTVLLQQGGQLKDLFGGVGNAARALGGYVAGLVNPFTVTAAAVGGIAFAFEKGAAEQREFQKTLILTGNAAGVTANLLSQAAANIDAVSGATQGKAAEALLVFVNAGIRGRESLERFTASAIEFERAGGGSIEKVAENFAKLGKDPLKASLELNDSMNFLTRSLYEQIKALEDQGKSTEAAKVAQEAYKSAIDTATPQLLQNLGLIERGWKLITDATKGAYDAALNVGRAATPAQQIAELQQRIASRGQTISSGGFASNEGGAAFGRGGAGLARLREEQAADELSLRSLSKKLLVETELTAAKTTQAESLKVALQADELRAKYLDRQVEKTKELAKINNSFKSGGLTEKERDAATAEVNKKYEEKPQRAASSSVSDSELTNLKARVQQEQIYLEQLKVRGLEADKLNEGEKAAIRISEELKGSLSGRARSIKEAALEQAKLLGQTISQADAEKDLLKRLEDSAKVSIKTYDDLVLSVTKSTDSINAQIEKENEAAAAVGKTKEQIAALEVAKLEDLAASKDRLAVLSLEDDYSGKLQAKYIAEAEALRGLAAAKQNRAGVETSNIQLVDQAKAAQKAVDDWKRASDQISGSLTDALLRGFESGKDFGQNLKDTFKNLSKTLILKPIIEMPVKQAVAALAPLQQKFTEFVSAQVVGYGQVTSAAVSSSTTQISASTATSSAKATEAVVTAGTGDPYTAFFRIAAMTAIMAGLGFAVKGGKGGSVPVTNQGAGTVFGDSAAKSASVDNSIKLLETSKLGLRYSAQMAASLKNIESAFAGVTNLLIRNGNLGELQGSIATGIQSAGFSRGLYNIFGAGDPFDLGRGSKELAKLFGKRISIQGSGITGGPQSLSDIESLGFQGNYYADIQTKKKFLGITTSTSNSTIQAALDDELARQFTQIFTGIGDSVTSAANALGIRTETVQNALSSYIVDIGKIDLKDLSGEEIQAKLSAVFGAEADKIAASVIPGFEQIQQVGEGYFETLVRAATQLESVKTTFDLLGGSLDLAAKSADYFRDKSNENFVNGTIKGAPGINQALVADQLVQQFGGLEEFNSATQAFYESFYSQGERTSATLGLLSTSLEGLGLTLPTSAAAFRELTTSLDVTTAAGQQAFEALVTIGPTFAELQNQLLESAGISGSAIADVLRDGMLGRITQADVGSKLSSIIIDGIYNSLANGFAEQISNTFTNQIIAPLLQSVATGGVLSASISQASIDTVVATATNAANQLAAILGDKGFQAAIAGVQAAISGIAGAFPGLASSAKEATPAYQSLGSAVNSASDAANKGADAWKSIGDSLTAEIDRIRGVLTGGDKASALASFATITAQTRAGDQEAAKLLPGASQAYIKAVEESASSLLDIRRAQGFALSSLLETRSIIGQGPAVSSPTSFTPNFTPSYSTGGAAQNNDAVVAELKLLRAQVARLEATSQVTSEVLERARQASGGNALAVEVQA